MAVAAQIVVANMVAQHGYQSAANPVPLRYEALQRCLQKVRDYASSHDRTAIQMPKIGAGLAGGDGKIIHEMLQKELKGLEVTVCLL